MFYPTILFCVIIFTPTIEGKFVKGIIRSGSDWEFLTRFCFLSDDGQFRFTFEYPYEYGIQNVLLYFDDPYQWESVYKTDTNCFQKEAVLRPENNQVITLSTAYTWSGCKLVNSSDTGWKLTYRCQGGRTFKSTRERWWFFAVSHCGFEKGLYLNYTLWMTNGQDFLHREYSADEFYIFPTHLTFFFACFLMLGFSVAVARSLKQNQLFHSTYKLYMFSLMCEIGSLLALSLASGKYGNTGVSQDTTKFMGRFMGAVGEWSFLLLVILLAKGFTVTVGRLQKSSQIKLFIIMAAYILTYSALFIVENLAFDPGLVLYVYESPAGYGLVALRLILWMWFCYSIFFTTKNHPNKRRFYYPFFAFYTLWFWAGPIVILISMHAIALWVREKTVAAVENFVAFLGYLFFLVLTRPGAANTNFPYHVKTTQIDVITDVPERMGCGGPNSRRSAELSTFALNPSTELDTRGPDFTDLFTVTSEKNKLRSAAGDAGDSNPQAHHNSVPVRLPPMMNPPRPPTLVTVLPSEPPSYDSLFRVS